MEEIKKIKILIKEPYKKPYVKEVEDNIKVFQEIVGGYFECVDLPTVKNAILFVNEEGKLDKLDGNFWLPEIEDCVVGTCFVVGDNPRNGESVSLTDKQIEEATKYIDYYSIPAGLDLYEDYSIIKPVMEERYNQFKKMQKQSDAEM